METNVTQIKFRKPKKRRPALNEGQTYGLDFPLLFAVCAVALFGVVMLFSASYYKGITENGDGLFFVKKQVIYLAIGIVLMLAASIVPYKIYKQKTIVVILYIVMLSLLIATKIFGKTVLGAQRWIEVRGFRFQPSELVKFTLIICLSYYMTVHEKNMSSFTKGICAVFLLILAPCVLIYMQPNMSMLIITVAVTALMLFIGGADFKQLLICGIAAIGGLFVLTLLAGYRSNRFQAWMHPWDNPGSGSYQVIQSMYAFANGGFFGQGFNESRQKLLFLPEMENDYVLAIIAEELGFIGVFLLIAAYAFIIYRGFRIALRSTDRFASLVAAGISGTLAIQVIINIAVVTNSIPSTGQPLPFISAGGTSLIVFLGAMGLLLNISRFMSPRKVPLFKLSRK